MCADGPRRGMSEGSGPGPAGRCSPLGRQAAAGRPGVRGHRPHRAALGHHAPATDQHERDGTAPTGSAWGRGAAAATGLPSDLPPPTPRQGHEQRKDTETR